MNLFGFLLGLLSLMIIGMGFLWVMQVERYLSYLWWPYILGLGCLCLIASLFTKVDWVSALLGAFGASLIWGSTELKHQAVRSKLGWYPTHSPKKLPPFYPIISKWRWPSL
ncbi:MAG: DUF4491 family protein [Anaerolineales bacterium]